MTRKPEPPIREPAPEPPARVPSAPAGIKSGPVIKPNADISELIKNEPIIQTLIDIFDGELLD